MHPCPLRRRRGHGVRQYRRRPTRPGGAGQASCSLWAHAPPGQDTYRRFPPTGEGRRSPPGDGWDHLRLPRPDPCLGTVAERQEHGPAGNGQKPLCPRGGRGERLVSGTPPRGHRFCRYADDCNIYVRSRRAGERVMASVGRFLTTKLRLKVNEAKSAVARPEERKFLGFSISTDGSERRIAPKALDKFKTKIREMTRRTRGISLSQLIEELTPYLIGWRGYFGFCQTPRVLTNLEAWIRRRLRSYLWRQWQNGHNRFNELRRRGVPKFSAAVAAGSPTGFWRMSG